MATRAKSSKKKPSPVTAATWTDGGEHVLILRRINRDGTSYNGFRWPDGIDVEVSCPDWNQDQKCGGGLHGWPWGMGLGEGSEYSLIDDRWLVIAARQEDVVGELEGGEKCKLRVGRKIYDGSFAGAWALINGGRHRLIDAMARDKSAKDIASGHSSKAASSGHSSTAASSGDSSTAASSGHSSTAASSGHSSKAASSGDYSKAASSGNYSKAAAAGRDTIAVCAGAKCRVRVGDRGAFAIPYWTDRDGWRFVCGKVGENGIKADTWYCVTNGELQESN